MLSDNKHRFFDLCPTCGQAQSDKFEFCSRCLRRISSSTKRELSECSCGVLSDDKRYRDLLLRAIEDIQSREDMDLVESLTQTMGRTEIRLQRLEEEIEELRINNGQMQEV